MFSEFLGTICDVTEDIRDRLKTLAQAADAAFRSDVSYSIEMAKASWAAKDKQQSSELVPAKAVGV